LKADDRHYSLVAELLASGDVIPFLGAGANLCDRPASASFAVGRFAPSGSELAGNLAASSRYPDAHDLDLLRVSQYVDAVLGEGQLYRYLHAVFDADYPPSSLHRLFAQLPSLLREHDRPQPLLVTTNYDDLVERALVAAGEPFDVVWYEAKRGPAQGSFLHRLPDGQVVPIVRPNKYLAVGGERTVVLKLHGAIDRADLKRDSYVITEDNYIDYMVSGDVGEQIPVSLRERMASSHFLFLGYSMRDWNLRVILKRIWREEPLPMKSWAVQRAPSDAGAREVEEALWRDRGDVDLFYVPLKTYTARLRRELFGPGPA
jgi:SIR2-like domain